MIPEGARVDPSIVARALQITEALLAAYDSDVVAKELVISSINYSTAEEEMVVYGAWWEARALIHSNKRLTAIGPALNAMLEPTG